MNQREHLLQVSPSSPLRPRFSSKSVSVTAITTSVRCATAQYRLTAQMTVDVFKNVSPYLTLFWFISNVQKHICNLLIFAVIRDGIVDMVIETASRWFNEWKYQSDVVGDQQEVHTMARVWVRSQNSHHISAHIRGPGHFLQHFLASPHIFPHIWWWEMQRTNTQYSTGNIVSCF